MSEWGNNPETYQAFGSLVTALGVIALFCSTLFAWWSLRETQAQRKAVEREMAARMRPWMGLFAFSFEPAVPESEHTEDVIKLLLKNFGALPAQTVHLSLCVCPIKREDSEHENAVHREETGGDKALLPGEDGDYRIVLSEYPQFVTWRDARRDVQIKGTLGYTLDQFRFKTDFEAAILFSTGSKEDDAKVNLRWRNQRVV